MVWGLYFNKAIILNKSKPPKTTLNMTSFVPAQTHAKLSNIFYSDMIKVLSV